MAPNENDPAAFDNVNSLPDDAVALLIWREDFGGQPLTIIISQASWDATKKRIMNDGHHFNVDSAYEFESPTNAQGRKSLFYLQKVIGLCANVHTGIVPAPKPKLVVPS